MKLLILFIALVCVFVVVSGQFVVRSGNKLYLNGTRWRYAGTNMYWLGLDENVGGVNYPTNFRVDDAMDTAVEMGANVIRAHTLGVSTGNSRSYERSLGSYQEAAIDVMDYAVWKAGLAGIKLVIPFTDNYHYYHGGKHDFTDWRHATEDEFWTNPTVIADFEDYIKHLISHVNNYTGLAFKDDPTIFAWETANEIKPPASWTKIIADFVKSIDNKHLVMDGTYGIANDALPLPSVDIYSDHFYPMDSQRVNSDAQKCASSNKVFHVGEYGWSQGDLNSFLRTLESQDGVTGDTYWSFFPHADDHGYVQHPDGFSLHYPGDNSDMQARVAALRSHAFRMRGLPEPKHRTPAAPAITSINGNRIAWRGAAAAGKYSVERSTAGANGPWLVICEQCATDVNTPWTDSAQPSGNIWYRVRGYNLDQVPGPYSQPVQK